MALGAAAIAGAAQIGSGLINYFGQKSAQKREFRENRQESAKGYAHDIDMWNRQSNWNREQWDLQNEYNMPAAQMQRLRDAGLNANLVAGGGGSAGGTAAAVKAAEMPKYNPARANYKHSPIQIPDMLGLYQNFKLKDAQIDNVKAQADIAKEKAMTEAQMRVHRVDGEFAGASQKYVNAMYQERFNELEVEKRKQDLDIGRSASGLKAHELKWMKEFGMRPNDPIQMRWLLKLMDKFGLDLVK